MTITIPDWVIYLETVVLFVAVNFVALVIISECFSGAMKRCRFLWIVMMSLTFRKYGVKWNEYQMRTMADEVRKENPEQADRFASIWRSGHPFTEWEEKK